MARVRYQSSLGDLERLLRRGSTALDFRFKELCAVYETDAEVAQAVVPKPLEAMTDPRIEVRIASVEPHSSASAGARFEVACIAVGVDYDGRHASYPLFVGVSGASRVSAARERYGLPAKHAEIMLAAEGGKLEASIKRKGIEFLSVATAHAPRDVAAKAQRTATRTSEFYTIKAFPGCAPSKGFDQDPQLLRFDLEMKVDSEFSADSDTPAISAYESPIQLRESAYDPVVDLPVRRVVEVAYREGQGSIAARVLRPVPGDWLLPFMHHRDDDPEAEGVEV